MITEQVDEGHDLWLWVVAQQYSTDALFNRGRHEARDILRACGQLKPTIRPDSDDQDCTYFNPRERTIPVCNSDGHYACRYWCKNFTPNDDEL